MAHEPLEMARDPNTSADQLRRLARIMDPQVRAAVAGNPNVPPDLLWALAGEFPGEVLHNPCLELLSLEDPLWLERPTPKTVVDLVNHPRVPEWFVEQALSGPPVVRTYIAYQAKRPDLLWRLVRKSTTDRSVLASVLNNPNASASLLEHLAVEGGQLVAVLKLHRHPAYFVEAALESRHALDAPELEALVRHPLAPSSHLERLAVSPLESVRHAVASAPAVTEALLFRLARDPSVRVREQVALHARCPKALAEKLRRELPMRPEPFDLKP